MSEFDFQPYLDFVRSHYAQSQGFYTPTDAILPLRVQSVEEAPRLPSLEGYELEDRAAAQKVEQFPVLEGLRRYALGEEREHVLLAGRPGSGKSMALRQLVVGLAGEGLVPVLVQLKGDRTVPELIKAEFRRAKVAVSESQIDDWLMRDRLILLLDGVNEIPTEDLRRELAQFREENLSVPMVLTTRDLAIGGDLGIEKRFEMRPLSPEQLREFVGKYLPGSGDRLLLQLRDRLREIAETPLLLKMLCDLFKLTGEVPQNKGELFRGFDREYDKFKGMPAVSEESRRFRSEVLQHLAHTMMVGDGGVDFELTIDRGVAEGAIEDLLKGRVDTPGAKAKEWLEDLVEHHLLQVAADGRRLEFHHQLFQEYYAAEWLLGRVGGMDDERLDCEFLNLLKWTEAVGLMLGLVEDEGLAVGVVERGLGVDLMLGARLAGGVRSALQSKTVGLIQQTQSAPVELPFWLFADLLAQSNSEVAISILLKSIEHSDYNVCVSAASTLGKLGSEAAISGLLKATEDYSNEYRRRIAVDVLRNISSEAAIPSLLKALEDSNNYVGSLVASALGKIGSEAAIPGLLKLIEHSDPNVRRNTAEALGEIGSEAAIPGLLKSIEHSNDSVRGSAAFVLGEIGSEAAIPGLLKSIEDSDPNVRRRAAEALGEIGSEAAIPSLIKATEDPYVHKSAVFALERTGSEAAIPSLIKAFEHSNDSVRENAVFALGKIGSEAAISGLIKALHLNDSVRCSAAEVLGNISSEAAIPNLLKALEDSDFNFRRIAAEALGKIGSEAAIPNLLKAVEDSDFNFRRIAAEALGKIGSEAAIPGLLKALEDSDSNVRYCAVFALGEIGSEALIPSLLKALEDSDSSVRYCAVFALGKIGSEAAIPGLLKAIENSDRNVHGSAADALGKFKDDRAAHILPNLLKLLRTKSSKEAFKAIQNIQANCKFYNYEIHQKAQAIHPTERQQLPSGAMIIYGDYIQGDKTKGDKYEIDQVGNLNTGTVNIIGNQIGEEQP